MSILAQFYFLFPWIQTESGNYNVIMYLARGFWLQDFSSMLKMDFPTLQALGKNDVQEISILFQMLLWIMMAVWIMSILILILTLLRKETRWLLPAMNVLAVIPNYFWTVSVSWTGDALPVIHLLYPMSLIFLNGIWLVAEKMAEAWMRRPEIRKRRMRGDACIKKNGNGGSIFREDTRGFIIRCCGRI